MAEVTQTYGYINTVQTSERLAIAQSSIILSFGADDSRIGVTNRTADLTIVLPQLLFGFATFVNSMNYRGHSLVGTTTTVSNNYQFWS